MAEQPTRPKILPPQLKGKPTGFGAAVILLIATAIAWDEGLVLTRYVDVAGIPTDCYGNTQDVIADGKTRLPAECEALLYDDIRTTLRGVSACVPVDRLQLHEVGAITRFAFNVGVDKFCASTMAQMIRAGSPASDWCAQLGRWVYAAGEKQPGLIKRRASERAMCEGKLAPTNGARS